MKKRGTAASRVSLYLEVEPETKGGIAEISEALGISKAATLDLILAHTPVGSDGRPEWWTPELEEQVTGIPADAQPQGRLDIAI